MSKLPVVSIIMPAYNAEKYIEKSIQSVLAQTEPRFELIVIDDCSKDQTFDVVVALAQTDSRISVYKNEQNMGVAKTRNRGLERCRGEYVAFLDSDDVWHSEKIQIQLECFEKTKADLVYTSYAIMDITGEKQCNDYLVPEEISFERLLQENVIGCSTVMITRELMKKYRFEESFFHEDYVLWLELLRSGYKALGVSQVLVDYLYHPDSKAGNKFNSAKKRWLIYRKYLRLSLGKSVKYLGRYAVAGLHKYKKTQ